MTRLFQYYTTQPLYHLNLLHRFFIPFIWSRFKKLVIKQYGLLTSNVIKSTIYWILSNLVRYVGLKKVNIILNFSITSYMKLYPLQYSKPVVLLGFSFHKSLYNTFMIYIFILLPHLYKAPFLHFNLFYSFILFPPNFRLYMFCNFYYFKIRHY